MFPNDDISNFLLLLLLIHWLWQIRQRWTGFVLSALDYVFQELNQVYIMIYNYFFISAFDTDTSCFLYKLQTFVMFLFFIFFKYTTYSEPSHKNFEWNLKPNSPCHCQNFCAGYIYFEVEVRSCYKLALRYNVNVSLSVIVSHVNVSRMFEVSM